jgi:serine/threonine-protein kinase PpkA
MKSGTRLNRYIIEKSISNHGGTAEVYLAHLVENENFKLAIKIAKTNANGKAHEDFLLEKESDLLQRWDWRHPGIVRVFPSPLEGGKPQYSMRATDLPNMPYYMVMEYLRGEALTQKLKTIQSYSLEWKLELFYQILMTVSFIHDKGYAHRDLKPDNIVFREPISPNLIPQPVLVDFALATNGDESFEVIENTLTIDYSPPERIAKSMGMSVKSNFLTEDIWSLGMIFYEILTGNFMIKGNKDQIKTTIIRDRLEPNLPNTPDYHILAAFIREMLNPDLEKRPAIDLVLKAIENKFLPPRIPML